MPMSSQAARAQKALAKKPTRQNPAELTVTSTYAVWDPSQKPKEPRPPIKWARKPWQSPLGLCLAVRPTQDGTAVEVLLEKGTQRTWVALQSCMTEAQASLWAKGGFERAP